MDLSGKAALVTGGAGGIGFAIAGKLLQMGANVAIGDINHAAGEDKVKELAKQFGAERVIYVPCDVTSEKEFTAAFEKVIATFGGIDLLVNNAGILAEKNFELEINVNVTGVVRGILLGIRFMGRENGGKGGTILNTASIMGIEPIYAIPNYCGTKCAVIGLTRSYGSDEVLQRTGVRVLALCPGGTDTPLVNTNIQSRILFIESPEELEKVLNCFPMQRVEHVANALDAILKDGTNGSCWVIESEKAPWKIDFPNYGLLNR